MASGLQNTWDTDPNNNGAVDTAVNAAEGQAPSTLNNGMRAIMAAVKKMFKDTAGGIAGGGTSTAYTLTTNEGLTLADGIMVAMRMPATNGAAATLNVDSTGAKAIQYPLGTACPAGALLSGGIYRFVYYASTTVWVLVAAPVTGSKSVGELFETSAVRAPAFSVFAYGQAVSRSTYAALLAATTEVATGDVANGSPTVSNVAADLRAYGLVGAKIEGTGIPSGTTISAVAATSFTLSQNATGNATATALTIFPHGNGDGSTTFNVMDCRGRSRYGRDGMGGTAASRLTNSQTNGIVGSSLGAAGGEQEHTLAIAKLPVVTPAGTIGNTSHKHNGGGPNTTKTVQAGSGASVVDVSGVAETNLATVPATFTGTPFGGGEAHNNMPPGIVVNVCVYTGV